MKRTLFSAKKLNVKFPDVVYRLAVIQTMNLLKMIVNGMAGGSRQPTCSVDRTMLSSPILVPVKT